ncbi:MAG: sulfatase-like hydrolase/transferase [Planctomycetes bacterium]|nr:sulfatase-like hydrolase/transferase [Planctomycetota bacterium]
MRWIIAIFVLAGAGAAAWYAYFETISTKNAAPRVIAAGGAIPRGCAKGFNVVLITLDTTRADHLGCYGYPHGTTPNIDAIARRAIRFEHAVTPAPITLPAHSSMMTGLDVPTHGVRNNGGFRLDDKHTTLAEVLRGAGYRTAAFIASFVLDRRYGLAQGFETYDDDVNPAGLVPEGNSFQERPAGAVVAAATKWLDSVLANGPRAPFFAWLHFFDPHNPYRPLAPYDVQHPDRPYDGEIAYVDAQIGVFLEYLRGKGVYDDTLFIITADHGEGLEEHGELFHAYLIYDSTVRVPLVVSCPNAISEPRVVADRAVGHIDLLPSIGHLLGVDVPAAIDGKNFFSEDDFTGRALHVETMATLLDHGWAALHGLRRVEDKYIQGAVKEYYDLCADPNELKNQFTSAHPAAATLEQDLAARLLRWPDSEHVAATREHLDPVEAERLAALGYGRFSSPGTNWGTHDPVKMLPYYNDVLRAEQWSRDNKHELAVNEIRRLLAVDGENAGTLYHAKLIYQRAKMLEEAEICLRKALKLAPRPDGYVQLAKLFLEQGILDAPEFDTSLEAAALLDPKDGGIHLVRGDRFAMRALNRGTAVPAEEAKRLLEDAIREFELAIEVDPVRCAAKARDSIARARGFLGRRAGN